MRIIGEITHPVLKITVFKLNDKISIKLEKDLNEIILKFRDGQSVFDLKSAKSFLPSPVLNKIEKNLDLISLLKIQQLSKLKLDSDTVFPQIL